MKDARCHRLLDQYAKACNFVWNFCVETHKETERRRLGGANSKWLSFFDMCHLTSGAAADLGIHSGTVSKICRTFVKSRDKIKKCPKFRSSGGSRRSLGWVPFTIPGARVDGDSVFYKKRKFRFWKSKPLSGSARSGCFTQDSRGRWYVCITCETKNVPDVGEGIIGIDLGLKSLATLSDGTKISSDKFYRNMESKISSAHKAGNKKRARAIYAKIKNSRRHRLHEISTKIARENRVIVVGDVSPSRLSKTVLAKSVMDAGWYALKCMLRYKAARRRAVYIEVDERYTSQTCSRCGKIPDSSPKGMGALGMRRWECSHCGSSHDRDINAAMNILRVGLECQPPDGEIFANYVAGRH